ncbi:MAG: histidinol dehydrogenase [Pseudomonadota bacterium]|nr:histidinol dehydrogenase [Pseudomonadota bacterium]
MSTGDPLRLLRLTTAQPDFEQALGALRVQAELQQAEVQHAVQEILDAVRREGDEALLTYTRRFDGWATGATAPDLQIPPAELAAARDRIAPDLREALESAADRLREYAARQRLESWRYTDGLGNVLGQEVRPLDRVGVYAPGGKAAYPSSVLMNVIPAQVAGVPEIILCVPTPEGRRSDLVLAAAAIVGVEQVFAVGGAQAVAALAYGTDTIPRVDKIVGPGNRFVATAKRLVFGQVGIDMIAGPSEILIICDGQTDPDWIALDLFSQAEHDEDAQSVLISPDRAFLDRVADRIAVLLPDQPRQTIIARALSRRGAFIETRDLDEAAEIANRLAPEHLELSVEDPESLLPSIRHAGAIFMGRYTPEAVGDYCAGPNHVLPTAGTARFFSPLGVYDFQKRSSIIQCGPQGGAVLGRLAATLATGEGFAAHAGSAAARTGL